VRGWIVAVAVCGCATGPGNATTPGDVRDPFGPDPEPAQAGTVEVALDYLRPGWQVTTTRSVEQSPPSEVTEVSDGTPIRIIGTATDAFVVTVSDERGALIAKRAMKSPCKMGKSHELQVPTEYSTIQAAVDAAEPGDAVKVAAGTYSESVVMRPGICLVGSGAKHTTLDAYGASRTLVDLTAAPGSVVTGFTLRGTTSYVTSGCGDVFDCGGDWYRAAIYIGGQDWDDPTHDAPPVIIDNVFEANDVAVMFYWRSNAELRNNVFVSNKSAFVANHFQDRALIANNVFFNNTQLAIGNQAAYLDVVDNIIVGSAVAMRFAAIQTGHIQCNLFWSNGTSYTDDGSMPERFAIGSDGNVIAEPMFVGNGDFHLKAGSPAINAGCFSDARETDKSLPDLGVYGGPLASWINL
jgi:hypothetical protein